MREGYTICFQDHPSYKVAQMFHSLQDDLLVTDAVDAQLFQCTRSHVQELLAVYVVVGERLHVSVHRIVQPWKEWSDWSTP